MHINTYLESAPKADQYWHGQLLGQYSAFMSV